MSSPSPVSDIVKKIKLHNPKLNEEDTELLNKIYAGCNNKDIHEGILLGLLLSSRWSLDRNSITTDIKRYKDEINRTKMCNEFIDLFSNLIDSHNLSYIKDKIINSICPFMTISMYNKALLNNKSAELAKVFNIDFNRVFIKRFTEYYNSVTDIITAKLNETIQSFIGNITKKEYPQNVKRGEKKALYDNVKQNKYKTFISLDLIQANWTIIRRLAKSSNIELPDWEDYISPYLADMSSMYEDIKILCANNYDRAVKQIFMNSKYFRHMLLKRIISRFGLNDTISAYQYELIQEITKTIMAKYNNNIKPIIQIFDETIFEVNNDTNIRDVVRNIASDINKYKYKQHNEAFINCKFSILKVSEIVSENTEDDDEEVKAVKLTYLDPYNIDNVMEEELKCINNKMFVDSIQ